MRFKISSVAVLFMFNYSFSLSERSNATTATLKELHIVFRHGHRTTEDIPSFLYPLDPHKNEKYYPYGYGQLTNKGKRKAFALGQWLRRRYDSYLGITYQEKVLEAVSSGYNRTAATLSLVLAGMYPPKGTDLEWNENLNWQPVLFNQLSHKDNYLSYALMSCPKYGQLLQSYLDSDKAREQLKFYDPLLVYLQKHTGTGIPNIFIAVMVYDILATQQEWGLELPEWAKPIYPNILYGAMLDGLEMTTGTTELKRYAIGGLVEKIVREMALKIANKTVPPQRKVFIYSAHDFNLMYLQEVLGVYTNHRPTYGACLMLELHRINNVYGVKIYYDTKSEGEPKLLKMPGCDYFCPFKKFYKLVKAYLPTKDMSCDHPGNEPFIQQLQ